MHYLDGNLPNPTFGIKHSDANADICDAVGPNAETQAAKRFGELDSCGIILALDHEIFIANYNSYNNINGVFPSWCALLGFPLLVMIVLL